MCDVAQGLVGKGIGAQASGIVPALAAILIAVAMSGCSTLKGQSQFSMAQPDVALVEPSWGDTSSVTDQAEARRTNPSTESGWTTRVYQYRGGRDPKTGLAKI